MAQNIEHIEAKLCAYIDGLLEPAEAAEIEKHLAANPAHRDLIEELKRLRQATMELPREKAPPEVAESLMGQLERSVLLAPADEEPILRIRHWSQITAAAAILLLALGLAAVVYLMLPSNQPRIAALPQEQQDRTVAYKSAGENEKDTRLARAEARPDKKSATEIDPVAGRGAAAPGTAIEEDRSPIDSPNALGASIKDAAAGENETTKLSFADPKSRVAKQLDALNQLGMPAPWCEELERAASLPARSTGYFLVATADVSQTRRRLVAYLDSNHIDWSYDGEASGFAIGGDTADKITERKAPAQKPQALADGRAPAPGALGGGEGGSMSKSARPDPARRTYAGEAGHAAPAATDAPKNDGVPSAPAAAAGGAGSAPGPTPSTGPSPADPAEAALALDTNLTRSRTAPPPVLNGAKFEAQVEQLRDSKDLRLDRAKETAPPRSVIVARGLSRQQIEQLASTLSAEQQATIRALRQTPAPAPATAEPVFEPTPGDELMKSKRGREDSWRAPATAPAEFNGAASGVATRPATAPAAEPASPHPTVQLAKSTESTTQPATTGPAPEGANVFAENRQAGQKGYPGHDRSGAEMPAREPPARFDCVIVLEAAQNPSPRDGWRATEMMQTPSSRPAAAEESKANEPTGR